MIIQTPQTVSELNCSIKLLLENGFSYVTVIGEISNLRKPYSGHQYFSLKDQNSQLKSVLFKMQQRYLQDDLQNGQQVICKGRISVYEPRGEYQLIVDSVDFIGSGTLQIAFERLKEKLNREGLFDPGTKKTLPFMPNTIALVTSPKGAAVQDFLHVASLRCPAIPIDIYPVSVQGDNAAPEIMEAIQTINTLKSADVIVLCRGGGSIEDLWSFNDEHLARTIFASHIPIVSAIGHEIDFTITDFVADVRAPTPTAAVASVMPDQYETSKRITRAINSLSRTMSQKIVSNVDRLTYQRRLLNAPINKINNYQLRVEHLNDRVYKSLQIVFEKKRLEVREIMEKLAHCNPAKQLDKELSNINRIRTQLQTSMSRILTDKSQKIQRNRALLKAVNPLAILDRGYAIVKTIPGKKIIKSSDEVQQGNRLEIKVSHGEFQCEVLPS